MGSKDEGRTRTRCGDEDEGNKEKRRTRRTRRTRVMDERGDSGSGCSPREAGGMGLNRGQSGLDRGRSG